MCSRPHMSANINMIRKTREIWITKPSKKSLGFKFNESRLGLQIVHVKPCSVAWYAQIFVGDTITSVWARSDFKSPERKIDLRNHLEVKNARLLRIIISKFC